MSAPVNLNRFRKAKARAERKARANANAALHGLAKSERIHVMRENSRISRSLDGKALQKPGDATKQDPEKP